MKTIKQIIAILIGSKTRRIWFAWAFLTAMIIQSPAQEGNKSLSFNGSSSKINFVNNDLQLSNNYQMAFGAWVNWSNKANAGHNATILSVGDSLANNGQFWLQHDYSNDHFQFVMQTDSGQKITLTSTSSPVEGNWYYIMGVFNISHIDLYVNGLLEASEAIIANTLINNYDNSFKASVGNSPNGQCGFNGLIDEISVWNNIGIDSAGAMDNLLVKLTGYETALFSLWNMDSLTATSTVADLGINHAEGTLWNVGQVCFGAPLGKKSTFVPLDSLGNNFKYFGRGADSLIVDSFDFSVPGIYIYEVEQASIDSTVPSGITPDGIGYHYGVFIPGFDTGTYNIQCYINPNDSGPGKRTALSNAGVSYVVLERNNQSPVNWINTGMAYTEGASFVFTNHHQWCQYSVGSLNTTQTAIHSSSITEVNAYPNPFNSFFKLALSVEKNTSVKILLMNVSGACVKEETHLFSPGKNEISIGGLNNLDAGLYFAKITDDKGNSFVSKIIKN